MYAEEPLPDQPEGDADLHDDRRAAERGSVGVALFVGAMLLLLLVVWAVATEVALTAF